MGCRVAKAVEADVLARRAVRRPGRWGVVREAPAAPYGRRQGSVPGSDGCREPAPEGVEAAAREADVQPRDADVTPREADAWADPDALEDLGDRIATLYAHVHAAEHRLLVMIEEFDRRKGWEPGGHRSCAHWLGFRTGIELGAARERVRAARALADLPRTSAAMARGELSFAKVRALTRVATAGNEAELIDFARSATAAQTERFVRAWRKLDGGTKRRWSGRGIAPGASSSGQTARACTRSAAASSPR